jgi:hypothetical protein
MHTSVGWVPASPGKKRWFWVSRTSQNPPRIGPYFQNWAGIGTAYGAGLWNQVGIGTRFGSQFWNQAGIGFGARFVNWGELTLSFTWFFLEPSGVRIRIGLKV